MTPNHLVTNVLIYVVNIKNVKAMMLEVKKGGQGKVKVHFLQKKIAH